MLRLIKIVCGVSGLLSLVACGGRIPSSYRGTFVDPNSGSSLVLKKDRGMYLDPVKGKIEAKAQSLTYSQLAKGQGGVFVQVSPTDTTKMDVYWIAPGSADRMTEVGGYRMVETGVVQTQMDTTLRTPAESIQVKAAERALVMLDDRHQSVEVVVPGDSTEQRLIRTE